MPGGEDEEHGRESDLVDLTSVPIPDLLAADDSVLANAIRRVLSELSESGTVVAGHAQAPTPR